MRNLSVVLMIASVLWLTALSASGPNIRLMLPGPGGGLQTAGPGMPMIPLGDDAGGSH